MVELLEGHVYRHQGRSLPGVTSILSAIDSGYQYVMDETMEHARKRGQAVHLACELHDKSDLDEDGLSPVIRPYLDAYKKFRSDTGFKPEMIEARMWHPVHGYAGTLDRVGMLGHRKNLIDIKAVASISKATAVQVAAYDELCRANGVRDIDERRALQLLPSGSYRLSECYPRDDHLTMFLALLTVKKWNQKYAN